MENKLTVKQAAELLRSEGTSRLEGARGYLEHQRAELAKLRKNSKHRREYERRVSSAESQVELADQRKQDFDNIAEVAEELYQLDRQIDELCELRRNLCPTVANPQIYSRSTMRNGFVN